MGAIPSVPVTSGWKGLFGGGDDSGGIDWVSLLLAGGAQAAKGVAGAKASKADRDFQAAQLQKSIDAKAAADRMGVAADESKLDPFRNQMSQANDIASLDRMERATYSPVRLSGAPAYAQYVPQVSGGSNYTKSPELVSSAAALKRNVMGGNVAPTMTNPANYGKTGALDLLRIAAQGVDPGTVSARSGAPGPVSPTSGGATDYMGDVPRRGGGTGSPVRGAAGGAMTGASLGSVVPGVGTAIGAGAGALVGALTGAFHKKAATAATDFSVSDASNVLTRAIQASLGRDPGPGEIAALLKAQGLKPGDRWVGESGLRSLLNQIQQSASAGGGVPSYTGRG